MSSANNKNARKRASRAAKGAAKRTIGRSKWPKARATDKRLIPATHVCAMLGSTSRKGEPQPCSKMHLWRLVNLERYRELNFPRPISINNRNYFRLDEVEAWIDLQEANSAVSKFAA